MHAIAADLPTLPSLASRAEAWAREIVWSVLHWFAVQVRPQHERRVASQLRRLGLATFVPVERRQRRPSRYAKRKQPVAYPLLPRYVLIGAPDLPLPWFRIFEDTEAQSVVGINGEPIEIERAEIGRLIRADESGAFDRPDYERFMRTREEFGVGDQVRILDGPLEGRSVRVEEIDEDEALFDCEILGTTRRLRIAVDRVELEARGEEPTGTAPAA